MGEMKPGRKRERGPPIDPGGTRRAAGAQSPFGTGKDKHRFKSWGLWLLAKRGRARDRREWLRSQKGNLGGGDVQGVAWASREPGTLKTFEGRRAPALRKTSPRRAYSTTRCYGFSTGRLAGGSVDGLSPCSARHRLTPMKRGHRAVGGLQRTRKLRAQPW